MVRFIKFEEALAETSAKKRHLLLGNGFSIALFPDRFRYGALLDQADFTELDEARLVFQSLDTTDFEVVIDALRRTLAVMPIYAHNDAAEGKIAQHIEALKELLVRAIAGSHPERPSDVSEDQYRACRRFLANFVGESRVVENVKKQDYRGKIYSLNYDLLLYWTLLHDQVIRWTGGGPLDVIVEDTEPLLHDDGFRAPPDDLEATYVTWDAEGRASSSQNVHFLHGGLHLFDVGSELQKRCWERSGGIPLIDQIRDALAQGKYPLFVSEGNSAGKLRRIRHSGYLQRSLRSFAETMRVKNTCLFIFGHSLAGNDEHVLGKISRGLIPRMYVSYHGDAAENHRLVAQAEAMAAMRSREYPLDVAFFNAAEAAVWG